MPPRIGAHLIYNDFHWCRFRRMGLHDAFASSSGFHQLSEIIFVMISRISCQLLMIFSGGIALSGNNAISIPNSSSGNSQPIPYFADMEHSISNGTLTIKIKSEGAELSSVVHSGTGLEYMWQRTAPFWNKSSPVLFPIVGALKDNAYFYRNQSYTLPRHGFAREQEFQVEEKTKSSITFLLKSDEASLIKYPFPFELRLRYEVKDDFLHVAYIVKNTGKEEMLFSIGGHPAFKVPLVDGKNYEDYHLLFNKKETTDRWSVSNAGLIDTVHTRILENENRIGITRALFEHDALVFKKLESEFVSIKSDGDPHGLDFYFDAFPFLGIWAQRNADFVCIEPWAGIADGLYHNQQLSEKEGIVKLEAGVKWEREWKVRFY